jgi:hypothetical protein
MLRDAVLMTDAPGGHAAATDIPLAGSASGWGVALYRAWEEPRASEPAGVYRHRGGRPHLGRKIAHMSQRELRDLGLIVDDKGRVTEAGGDESPAPDREVRNA